MRKVIKIVLFIIAIVFLLLIGIFSSIYYSIANLNIDKNKLVDLKNTISLYDENGRLFAEKSNGICVTDITAINDYTKKAFVAIEDKRFYSHNGVDFRGVLRATKNNLFSFSFKEGASTISQQLIKNTHLSSEKTLKRKLSEIKLAKELEKEYTKDQILEMYLNTIYFGSNCYGITSASKHYFNKSTKDLTLNESAALAGLIKAPSTYSPYKNLSKCNKRKNLVLNEMLKQGYITEDQYKSNIKADIVVNMENENTEFDYAYLTTNYLDEILNSYPYKKNNVKVYTNYNSSFQNILKNAILDCTDCNYEKSAIIMDNKGRVKAYYSTCGDNFRQIGSTIKPLLVYAPAIQENVVSSITPILDEKTNFNKYTPTNYNNKYYGYVSVKETLAKSMNASAVKILNYLTIDKAKSYINKTDIKLTDNDNSLAIALGSTEKGCKLSSLTAGYSIFPNKGKYNSPNCISKIYCNHEIYNKNAEEKKIIDDDTAFIMNDMLKNVVQNGTAKKLSYLEFDVYGKTGTVGNKNGNTDAYIISFTGDYTLGVWVGTKDYTSYMKNQISGGTVPTLIANEIWKEIYKDRTPSKLFTTNNVIKEKIDKISLEEEHKVILADDNTPERYKIETIFRKSCVPKEKSTRFSTPKIKKPKTSIYNNEYSVLLCQTEYIETRIIKEQNGKKSIVFDTKNKKYLYKEKLNPNIEYRFYALPYYDNGENLFFGEEILLDTIKSPSIKLGDWWIE